MRCIRYCIAVAALVGAAVTVPTHAQTTVGGFIESDTLWSAADGPFIVDQSILVTNNATLTIEPGTEVRIAPDRGLVVDEGQLIARGTQTDKITFTADVPDLSMITDEQRWGFIRFADGATDAAFDAGGQYLSGSIIEHAIVQGAGGVIGGAINAQSANPFISQSLIQNNRQEGIHLVDVDGVRIVGNTLTANNAGIDIDRDNDNDAPRNVLIAHNTIHANGNIGISIDDASDSQIIQNTVTDNEGIGILLDDSRRVSLTENTVTGNRLGIFIDDAFEEVVLTRNRVTENRSVFFTEFPVAGVLLDPRNGHAITLNGDEITHNEGAGVVVENTRDAMELVLSGDPTTPTQIFGNVGVQLDNASPFHGATLDDAGNVDARHVFWNTTDPAQIEDGITDFFDDVTRGIVFFDPFFEPTPGDVTLDDIVGIDDLILLGDGFDMQDLGWVGADFNNDGVTDVEDLFLLGENWSPSNDLTFNEALQNAGLSHLVPEPTSLVAMMIGMGAMSSRRRGRA